MKSNKLKFISLILVVLFGGLNTLKADDDKPVKFDQLPAKAKQFINSHFSKDSISFAKKDTDLFDGEYEIFFTNGDKVVFEKNGELKEIKCFSKAVPASIVPTAIAQYVASKHNGDFIVKFEFDKRDFERYEIKLNSGIEIKFNSKGQFIRYDR